jgi:peroxiredoxin/Ca2+-binding EF-hand superfamily protein
MQSTIMDRNKKMNWKIYLAGGLLSCVAIGSLDAQTREGILNKLKVSSGEWGERFKSLDSDGDGRLSRDEVGPELFAYFNSDGNDYITMEEAGRVLKERGKGGLREVFKSDAAKELLSKNPTDSKRPAPERPRAESPVPVGSDQKTASADPFALPSSTSSDASSSTNTDLREGPRRLVGGEFHVGQKIADLEFSDKHGKRMKLSDFDNQAIVVAFTNTTCPVCKKYSPTLGQLEKEFAARGVVFLFVNPTPSDKDEDIDEAVKTHGLKGRYVRDLDGKIAMALGATRTTDAFVLDAKRTLLYRGAVDDQYGFGYSIDRPRREYLRDALESVLVGEPVLIAATSAPGCPLNLSSAKPLSVATVTYHDRISRILQSRCIECHRDGGVAPFALTDYQEVTSQSGAILQVIEKGAMPPWFAVSEAKDGEAGPFINDCSLSRTEKKDLLAWLRNRMPEGDVADAPVKRVFKTDWQIGEPDRILQLDKPIAVKASGTMPYQNVFIDTGFSEDKYIKAVEVRPTAREVVHHILVFVLEADESGRRASREAGDDESGGFFAAYAPGYDALSFNEGYGKKIPAGSRLKFQIHYTPNGVAVEDRPMIGMRFLDSRPEHLLNVAGIAQIRLAIPPNTDDYEVVATQKLPNDASISAFFPHMHLRGKSFKYEAVLPNGEIRTLLDIPRYDFNWQLSYRLADTINLPKGTAIKAIAHYDNSSKNPANPDPNRTVRWGQQTTDEMMIGYIEYHMDDGSLSRADQVRDQLRERLESAGDSQAVFKRLDRNGNGQLESSEIPEGIRNHVTRLDTNKDGVISREEAEKARRLFSR